jgi:RNA polymerase sigma factor (sigma-70 family)
MESLNITRFYYGDRAFRLATRITGHAEDAEEVVQDALWSVIRKIEMFGGDSAFGSWLYRVVANAAYQRLRKRRGRSADVSLDTVFDQHGRHAEPVADWSMSIEDPARQMELRILLEAAIEELSGGLPNGHPAARRRGALVPGDRRGRRPEGRQRQDAPAPRAPIPEKAARRMCSPSARDERRPQRDAIELAEFNGAIPFSGDSRTSRTGHHLTGEVFFARMWRRAEVAQL